MKRYFEKFYNDVPMVELSEQAAVQSGDYTLEDDVAMRRYLDFIDGELNTIIYAKWDSPEQPLADLRALHRGVRAVIYSPVVWSESGGRSWRAWYVAPDGTVRKVLEPEFDAAWQFVRESLRQPDGELVSYTVYHYHRDGYLLELITHAPDGTITSRQDA